MPLLSHSFASPTQSSSNNPQSFSSGRLSLNQPLAHARMVHQQHQQQHQQQQHQKEQQLLRKSQHQPFRDHVRQVTDKRLHFVSNINLIVALVASIVLAVPYPHFMLNLMLTFVVRAPLLYGGMWVIIQSRKRFSTTQYPWQTTLISHIIVSAVSAAKIVAYYAVSAYILAVIMLWNMPFRYQYYLISKEFRARMYLNDEWAFYWCYPMMVASLYAFTHMFFSRNRLVLQPGSNPKREPSLKLLAQPKVAINVVLITTVLAIGSWPMWQLTRGIVYSIAKYPLIIAGLDYHLPPIRLHFSTWASLTFATGVLVTLWELTNRAYDIYVCIGCVDGSKPVASSSVEPISCIIAGCGDDDEFVKAMAFQELAYIATSPQTKQLRDIIYNRSPSGWGQIYAACESVINQYCERVNYRSPADISALRKSTEDVKDICKLGELNTTPGSSNSLFGNSNPQPSSASTIIKPYQELQEKDTKQSSSRSKSPLAVAFNRLSQLSAPMMASVEKAVNNYREKMRSKQYRKLLNTYRRFRQKFLHSGVGFWFRVYVKHDAEARVLIPLVVSNAAIALSHFVTSAIDEDRSETITNRDICKVLDLLERPVRVSLNYVEYLPASVYVKSPDEAYKSAITTAVAKMHDLIMDEFCNVCIKYNYKLHDLVVNIRTHRLAKKVIDELAAKDKNDDFSRFL
ncbi:hypothetical protein DICA1_E22870 [Diutina catenulata]